MKTSKIAVAAIAAAIVLCALTPSARAWKNGSEMRPEEYWSDPKVIALAKAIDRDDLDEIEALVRQGVDLNAPHLSKSGQVDMRPLSWAMYRKKKAAYKRLLDRGADSSLEFGNKPSFLHFAAFSLGHDSDWLRMALEHGADPNLGKPDRETPIFNAIFNAPIDSLNLLIAAGADLNCRGVFDLGLGDGPTLGDTPLLHAATLSNFEAVHRLLEAGADYRLRCRGFDDCSDLAYELIASGVDPQSENGRWREKAIDWLAAAGVDLRDARCRCMRCIERKKRLGTLNEPFEPRWLEIQKGRVERWLAIEPDDARDHRVRGSGRLNRGRLDAAIADFTRAVELEPGNAVNYVLRARTWCANADSSAGDQAAALDSAVADYTAAIEIDPAYAEAFAERAIARAAQEKYLEAVADYTTAIGFYPSESNPAPWLWRRADARRRSFAVTDDRKQLDHALADCDRSIALIKDDPQAHRARGDVLAAQGSHDKAIAEYSEAIELHRHCGVAHEGRARCWAAKGDQARAEANRKEAAAYKNRYADWLDIWHFQPVIDDLTRILNDDPDNVQSLAEMAQLLAGCPDRDFRDGAKALEYATKACELTAFKAAQPLAALAAAHAELGNLDAAIESQKRAIQAQPDEPPGRDLLDLPAPSISISAVREPPSDNPKDEMRQRLTELEFEKAIAGPNEAVRAHPEDPAGYVKRAAARYRFARESGQRDEYDRAIEDCNRAIELDPTCARAFYIRGNCRRGDFDKRIDDYSEAIRLDPSDANHYAARGAAIIENARMAAVFAPQGAKEPVAKQYDQAIADLSIALRLSPENNWTWYNRGRAWMAKREYLKAAEDFSRAIELDADYGPFYAARASAWIGALENDKAIADCDAALAIDPKDEDSLARRGEIWLSKKEYDRALADFDAAGDVERRRLVLKASGRFKQLIDELRADIEQHPRHYSYLEQLAVLFAGCPKEEFRDGPKAVELAGKACKITGWKRPSALAALAAAHAEAGDFTEAINRQKKAIELTGEGPPKEEYRRRLALYERGEPFREALEASDGDDDKCTTSKTPD